ncbi:putative virus X resistance protein-like, coiled-coil [Helianthus debilis subsp. tardiflorus]
MADAAVEFLLGNLKQLLVYNAHLISSVKDQVDSLCNDLRLLAAFVKETTESRNKHAVVKELVRRIRIEVYKAEDIVDMYVFHASVQKSRTHFVKALHIPDYSMKLRSVGREIQDIRRRVKEIQDNKLFANEVFHKTETFIRLKCWVVWLKCATRLRP